MPDISSPLSRIFPLFFLLALFFTLCPLSKRLEKSSVKQIKKYWRDQWFEIMLATKAQYIYDSYLLKYLFMTGTS